MFFPSLSAEEDGEWRGGVSGRTCKGDPARGGLALGGVSTDLWVFRFFFFRFFSLYGVLEKNLTFEYNVCFAQMASQPNQEREAITNKAMEQKGLTILLRQLGSINLRVLRWDLVLFEMSRAFLVPKDSPLWPPGHPLRVFPPPSNALCFRELASTSS